MNNRSNFIPQEGIVCDDKDPQWFNGLIKQSNLSFKKKRHI